MFARMWYICTMSSHTDWSAILCPWSRYSVVTSLSLVVVRRRRPTTLMPPRPSGTHPPVLSSRVITWALTRASQSSLHHRRNHNCQAASLSDTIRDAILRCNQKLTRVSLIYRTEPTSKKWKNRKKLQVKMHMLRSIGKQSGESVQSVLTKKRKAMVGRICTKGSF